MVDNSTVSQPNPLEILREQVDNATVLRVASDLCYSGNGALLDAVSDSLSRSAPTITLDLGNVQTIDSSGVRSLLEAHKACEEAGSQLRIDPASECVARILELSGLTRVFGLPEAGPLPDPTRQSDPMALIGSDTHESEWQVEEHVAASDPYVISVLRDKATDVAARAGAVGEVLCDIQIAVGEALANAYVHGSPRRGLNRITLRCLSCGQAVAIEVEDQGEPFDPDAVPEPDPSLMRDHGMGISLMRTAMDIVEFTSGCPGNRVRMVKWLKPRS